MAVSNLTDVFVGKQIIYTPHFIQNGGSSSKASYISVSPVRPGSTINGRKTGYWKYYYREAGTTNKGYSTAVVGEPPLDVNSVLNNCIGTAQGRFGEIFAEICDTTLDFHAGKNYSGDVTAGDKMPGKPEWTYSVSNSAYVKKIMPGTIFCYIRDDTKTIHAATVEEILERDANGLPTKVSTSSGHYGDATRFITRETVSYNGGKWTVGVYRCYGYIFNPAIKQYTFPGDKYGTLNCIKYFSGDGLKVGTSFKYNSTSAKGFSALINFITPSVVSERCMIFGNYINDAVSAINLEIKDGKLRLFVTNSAKKTKLDKLLNFNLLPNTEYTAKFSFRDGKYYFGLLNVDCDFVSGNFDLSGTEYNNFKFFRDNRAANAFTRYCLIKSCVIYSNYAPKNVFVPISLSGQAGLYDLQTSAAYLNAGVGGYINDGVRKEVESLTDQISNLNSQISTLKNSVNSLNSELASKKKEITVLNEKNITLTTQNATLNEKLDKALLFDVDGDGKRTESDGVYLIKNVIAPDKYPLKTK